MTELQTAITTFQSSCEIDLNELTSLGINEPVPVTVDKLRFEASLRFGLNCNHEYQFDVFVMDANRDCQVIQYDLVFTDNQKLDLTQLSLWNDLFWPKQKFIDWANKLISLIDSSNWSVEQTWIKNGKRIWEKITDNAMEVIFEKEIENNQE